MENELMKSYVEETMGHLEAGRIIKAYGLSKRRKC